MMFSTTYLDAAGVQIRKVVGKREESDQERSGGSHCNGKTGRSHDGHSAEKAGGIRCMSEANEWVAAREADSAYFSHKLLRLPRPRIRSGPPSTLLSTRYFYFSSALSVQRRSKHSAALVFPARLT